MVGSNVRMEHAASTPSLVLLEQLMDSTGDGGTLRSYPCSRKRSSLPTGATPPSNPPGTARRTQNLLQDLIRSSRRGKKGASERKGVTERKGPSEPGPMTRRIWCDSKECLASGPFIRIQAFNPSGQCVNCGRTMRDAATNTECSQQDESASEGTTGTQQACGEKREEQSPSRTEDPLMTNVESLLKDARRRTDEKDSQNTRFSRKKSLPASLDWWSDKILKRQSSNLKDNVRKSWYGEEATSASHSTEELARSPATKLSFSDQSLSQIKVHDPRQRAESRRRQPAKKEVMAVSKSTPNLSYPSTQVHKSHSARLAGWWEESPFPVRSQRFTFHSHSSGNKVVLRKGQSMFEVSARGTRRHSTNFADLEELMGAVSGSEEEEETDEGGRSPTAILLPYQALEEEMDALQGNVNQSNSTNSSSFHDHGIAGSRASRHRSVEFKEVSSLPNISEINSLSTPHINSSMSPSPAKEWAYMSPSLENVIQWQFLRNTSMASLQCQQEHCSVLPGKGLHTPKRLQSATRTGTKRRREPLRHSWAGHPNPLSKSVLRLAEKAGERSSWMGVIDDLPVIREDRGREWEREGAGVLPSNALLESAMLRHHKERIQQMFTSQTQLRVL